MAEAWPDAGDRMSVSAHAKGGSGPAIDRLTTTLRHARGTMSPGEVASVDRLAAEWRDAYREYGLDPADPQVAATMLVTAKLLVRRVEDLAAGGKDGCDYPGQSLWAAGESALIGLQLMESARPHRPKPGRVTASLVVMFLVVGMFALTEMGSEPASPSPPLRPTESVMSPDTASPTALSSPGGNPVIPSPIPTGPSSASTSTSIVMPPTAAHRDRTISDAPSGGPTTTAYADPSSVTPSPPSFPPPTTERPPSASPVDPGPSLTDVVGGVLKDLQRSLGL